MTAMFKNKNAAALGIIGGADGSISIWVNKKRKAKEELAQKAFLDFAATQVTANWKPFADVEALLIAKYKALPYSLSEFALSVLKANIIMTRFKEVLALPAPLPPRPTKKQLLEYAKNDTTFEQARHYPAEKLGLVMKAYQIPTETDRPCIVELEMTTEYMSISNADEQLSNELCLLPGISQKDIDERTPRFIRYACRLRSMGLLHFKE